MKKILLIITIALCIFQMVVLAIAIDIGAPAIDRGATLSNYTVINKDNPANETGKITSIEIWANVNLTGCEVATFFIVSGNNFSTRDTHAIGNVTAGSKQTFSGLDITVEAGDYIGIYAPGGTMERDSSGGAGIWYVAGVDHIPCTNQTFTFLANNVMSLYGIGATTPTFPIAKFGGVVITKWNTKEITKWNTIE